MKRQTLGAVLMAALLVLAGCSGVATPPADASNGATDATGSVDFYLSDEPNAIDDFEHLNVTITKIGLHRTDAPNDTDGATPANGTPGEDADDRDDDDGEDGEVDDDADGEWIEYDVQRTVDLTELQGANATKLDSLDVPEGTYDAVFIYVEDVNGTLTTGEQVDVKLPSDKLQIHKTFTVGDGEPVEFVFDVAPHKAGQSGKYILKPVISQSGTGEDVDIDDVDEDDADDEADERRDDEADERRDDQADDPQDDEADLTAAFVGEVEAGSEATLKVTGADGPVENATVEVNGEVVGQTDASGTITFTVPADAEELDVVVTKGDAEVELERDLADE